MSIIINPATGTVTTSSGSASATLVARHDILMHMFVKATTSSTTFDVTLTDHNSNVVLTRTDQTGELNELIQLPTFKNLTFAIANASADESFTYSFAFRES